MEVEKALLGTVDYIIFAFMLLVSAFIGVYFRFAGGQQKTTEEYLLAGKDMSILPVAFSLMASFLSAITVIGIPAEMYTFGINLAFLNIGFELGLLLSAFAFLPVFFHMQAATAYHYLEMRFGKLTRVLSSLVFVVQMILYMSVVLYAPALALSAVTNLSIWVSVVSIGVVCTFYCTLGGMKAVLWTDVFQAILMYIGLFAILIKGCIDVGGFGEVFRRAKEGGRLDIPSLNVDFTTRYTMWNLILQGLLLSLSCFGGNQVQIQRLLTVKNINKSRLALFVSIPMGTGFHLLTCLVGIVIYSYFYRCDPMTSPQQPITSPDQLMPYYMMTALGDYPGLPGLCICGVFSASLSTISSAVNSLSAVTMEDFVRPLFKAKSISQTKAVFAAKAITLFYGALCVMLTFLVAMFGNLIQASLTVFGMLGGPAYAVFFLGMMTTRSNEKGVIFGLITGIAFSAWMSFGASANAPPPVVLPVSTEECVASNLTNFLPMFTESAIMSDNMTESSSVIPSAFSSFDEQNSTLPENDLFPLYKVSYMWFNPLGFFFSAVVGYLASVIFSIITGEKKDIPHEYLSPFLRWFLKEENQKTKTPPSKKEIEISVLNGKNHFSSDNSRTHSPVIFKEKL